MTEQELNKLMIMMGTSINEKVSKDIIKIIYLIIATFLIITITVIVLNYKDKVIYKDNFTTNDLFDIKIKGKQKCLYYRKSNNIVNEYYTICK